MKKMENIQPNILDLETLKCVKNVFIMHSDESCKTNGYRSLCGLIERQESLAPKPESIIDSAYIEKLINEFKKEALPSADVPFHYDAEVAAGLKCFVRWLNRKEDKLTQEYNQRSFDGLDRQIKRGNLGEI